jgi:ribonucleotide monophosphatase NagD (HAD superfamily)
MQIGVQRAGFPGGRPKRRRRLGEPGPWAGLEQAAGVEAVVVGKPAAAFFATALAHLGASATDSLMVGDDIETDVLAAQRQGLTGVLVKTGKYLPSTLNTATGTPDHVLGSFADLPALLEQLS